MKRDANDERLAGKHIVLLGVGHTNAHIVRKWGMNPIPDADLTCISDNSIATYSGMLPAVLAGQIPKEEMELDLVRLCSSVGAGLIVDQISGLDQNRQLIHFTDRPPVPYDVLSIGIGSVPTVEGVHIEGTSLLKIKPMQTFLQRLETAVEDIERKTSESGKSLKVLIAGSGVAGTEIAFCLPAFLQQRLSRPVELRMVTRSDDILYGVIPSMRQRVHDELQRRGVQVKIGKTIVSVTDGKVTLNDGQMLDADLVLWATGASPPDTLAQLGLPLDDQGFLATDNTLRSTSGQPVFAVGDTGTIVDETLPKAGVYAVRQGPVLWKNIQAVLHGNSLVPYEPQRSFLKLLNTGDGRAIGEWKGASFSGRWVKALKDYIDGRFMKMYRVPDVGSVPEEQMQCKGCGCKLGGDVLEGVISSSAAGTPIIDDHQLDDAAIIDTSGGQVIASTDFFTSPFQDPWLTGRVVALHSASDLVAMGANVKAALANVVVPEGDPVDQKRVLSDLLEGARLEFSAMGADIVGGHTIVGPRCEIGFTVIGEPSGTGPLLRKGGLKVGDQLYLTKPLGVGALLAAHMQSQCRAADYETLVECMLQRQHSLSSLAADLGICAGTDITGFGLIGHLLEMLQSSSKSATIDLSRLPLLPGVAAAISLGIESTLVPQNRHVEKSVIATDQQRSSPEYKALFDPQTCGGLLLGVSKNIAAEFESRVASDACVSDSESSDVSEDSPSMRPAGRPACVCIGEVAAEANGKAEVRII